jgi:hypothetical protein
MGLTDSVSHSFINQQSVGDQRDIDLETNQGPGDCFPVPAENCFSAGQDDVFAIEVFQLAAQALGFRRRQLSPTCASVA